MAEKVSVFPSKSFFVSTLTRDIELKDAILDLLDNCVDGILRHGQKHLPKNAQKPYDGYWAKIDISPTVFVIEDNCGGISKNIAENSAFRLGRVDVERDKDLPTVGMYGIGMKRAIFKMGRKARICSRHEEDSYCVEISPEWLSQDENWELPLNPATDTLKTDGTRIEVSDLYENISRQLDSKDFIDELHRDIANFFAIILDKGFKVFLDTKEIQPADFRLLFSDDFSSTPQIQPYAYQAEISGVSVKIVVGFYRELASVTEIEKEVEEEQELPTRKSDNAGWTVICNDRVILYRDKSRLTGWGVRDVPKYHTQFIAIAGVVIFTSNESLKLPLSTTKRNLDTSSEIYGNVLNRMMDGLKEFTSFTNHWKGREEETAESFKKMKLAEPSEIVKSIPKWSSLRGSQAKEEKFVPLLPKPSKEKTKRRISFYRSASQITKLSEFFFDDTDVSPSEVGEKCFDEALKKARGKK